MKKILFVFMAFIAVLITSCGGNNNIKETQFKFVDGLRFRAFTVEIIDSNALMSFVENEMNDSNMADHYYFYVGSEDQLWIDKFKTSDEIVLAVGSNCPDCIIVATGGAADFVPCEWFVGE